MTIKPENIKKLLTAISNSNEPPTKDYIKSAVGSFGNEDVFNRTFKFCEENHFTERVDRALNKDRQTNTTSCIEISKDGVNYLISEKNLEIERIHSNIIKKATIVIAIATVINVIVAFLNYIK